MSFPSSPAAPRGSRRAVTRIVPLALLLAASAPALQAPLPEPVATPDTVGEVVARRYQDERPAPAPVGVLRVEEDPAGAPLEAPRVELLDPPDEQDEPDEQDRPDESAGSAEPSIPGFLGVELRTDGSPEAVGAAVAGTVARSAAASAGVRPGDVIVALDGQPIADHAALQQRLGERRAGDEVELELVRDGARHVLVVTLGARSGRERPPSPSAAAPGHASGGAAFDPAHPAAGDDGIVPPGRERQRAVDREYVRHLARETGSGGAPAEPGPPPSVEQEERVRRRALDLTGLPPAAGGLRGLPGGDGPQDVELEGLLRNLALHAEALERHADDLPPVADGRHVIRWRTGSEPSDQRRDRPAAGSDRDGPGADARDEPRADARSRDGAEDEPLRAPIRLRGVESPPAERRGRELLELSGGEGRLIRLDDEASRRLLGSPGEGTGRRVLLRRLTGAPRQAAPARTDDLAALERRIERLEASVARLEREVLALRERTTREAPRGRQGERVEGRVERRAPRLDVPGPDGRRVERRVEVRVRPDRPGARRAPDGTPAEDPDTALRREIRELIRAIERVETPDRHPDFR